MAYNFPDLHQTTSTTNEFRSQTNLRFFTMSNLTFSEPQSHINHFDRLPNSILILIFNKISDVKALGWCCIVSCRFHSLILQVDNVIIQVDCVISDDDSSSSSLSALAISSSSDKSCNPFSNLFRFIFDRIFKPLQLFTQFLNPKRPTSSSSASFALLLSNAEHGKGDGSGSGVTHHSPTQVLKDFKEICFLQIELPIGELGINDAVLFFREDVEFFYFIGFLCVCFPRKFLGLWVC